MHDIGRAQLETSWETQGYEMDGEEELYGESSDEFYGETGDGEGSLDEVEEMELAAELLEVTDETELDQFLGNLIKRAGRAVGGLNGPLARTLGGMLKGVARKALPMAGTALGNMIVPGGGAIGGQLASAAGRLFGLELEGMSAEDQEFEVARRFVRLAGDAVKNAAQVPPATPAATAAQNALMAAAQQHAPGLLRSSAGAGRGAAAGRAASANRGRWVRRGRTIILFNV